MVGGGLSTRNPEKKMKELGVKSHQGLGTACRKNVVGIAEPEENFCEGSRSQMPESSSYRASHETSGVKSWLTDTSVPKARGRETVVIRCRAKVTFTTNL